MSDPQRKTYKVINLSGSDRAIAGTIVKMQRKDDDGKEPTPQILTAALSDDQLTALRNLGVRITESTPAAQGGGGGGISSPQAG